MATVITNELALEHLAANVNRLLRVRGMTQRELAKATGEEEMTISRICRGLTMPGFAVAVRIAEAFDVDVSRLAQEPPREPGEKSRRSA